VFETSDAVPDPSFGFMLANSDGVEVSGFGRGLTGMPEGTVLQRGERVHVSAALDNRLAQGRYVVQAYAHAHRSLSQPLLGLPRILDFVVYGTVPSAGVASLFTDAQAIKEER
jgi:hypothetical protein